MTKKCGKCGKVKDIEEFFLNSSKTDGRQSYCKECKKRYDKKYFQKNKQHHYDRRKNRARNIYDIVDGYKGACTLCGEDHIATLVFHHEDPKEKELSISIAMKYGWSVERLLKEIKKCVVLCCNCHAKLHWNDKQGPKL